MDLALGCGDFRNVMKHAMAEHHVERVMGERECEDARGAQLVERQSTAGEAGSDAIDRFLGEVDARPPRPRRINCSDSAPSPRPTSSTRLPETSRWSRHPGMCASTR